jgi:polygalacturonase
MLSDIHIDPPTRPVRRGCFVREPYPLAMILCFAGLHIPTFASTGPAIPKPSIPARNFIITEHGAVGDGVRNNAAAIQKTIDVAGTAGGGRVVIPAGKFVSGPISLKNHIDLHFDKGAFLLMSPDVDDFPVANNRRESFISANGMHDIRISGEGTIDGQGEPWWKAFRAVKGSADTGPRRPQMIYVEKCERIELDGFSTLNPPNTHCSLRESKDITINGLTMRAPDDSANTDALNLSIARNVIITRCDISTGDDNIVLLCSGKNDPADPKISNVTIKDCKFGFGHGLSIGSYTSGGVRNVHAENLSFDGTTSGIRMKAWRDRGGVVKGISYRNITMRNVKFPIYITSYYPKTPKGPAEDLSPPTNAKNPEWTDITIENVTVTDSPNSIILWGLPDRPITNIFLKNVKASTSQGAVVFHSEVTFAGVKLTPGSGPSLQTFNAKVVGMDGVPFNGNFKAK